MSLAHECPICLDQMTASSTLSCGHAFHSECIISHLRKDNRCPICRDAPTLDVTTDDTDYETLIDLARNLTDRKTTRLVGEAKRLMKQAKQCHRRMHSIDATLKVEQNELAAEVQKFKDQLWISYAARNHRMIASRHKQSIILRQTYTTLRNTMRALELKPASLS